MNRDFVLFHLREVAEEMSRTVREIESDPEYGAGQLLVAMQHTYHHLNSAWNGREIAELKALNINDSAWNRLGGFPPDFPLMKLS